MNAVDPPPTDPTSTSGPAPAPDKGSASSGAGLHDFAPRLVSAVVMICLALTAAWLGGDLFVLFWMVAGLAVAWEWQTMIDAPAQPARFVCAAIVLVLATVLARHFGLDIAAPLLLAGGLALAWLGGRDKRWWAAGGLLYAAGLPISVTVLRLSLLDGFEVIIWLFAVVWGTDIFAYVGGRMIGGPKLWPRVSPGKTWAGFIVGVFSGGALGWLAYAWLASPGFLPGPALFALGLLAGAIAQAGDLFESAMKRRFGRKDSSRLIPGHGGFMDRLDGFIFAAIFAACIGGARQGLGSLAVGVLRW